MKTILYAQPIFIPNEDKFVENKLSIESFGAYLKRNINDDITVMCVFAGWASTDDLWNKIFAVIKENIPNILLIKRFAKNNGKAVAMNTAIKAVSHIKYSAILTVDSDMIFPSDLNYIFERLNEVTTEMVKVKKIPWGMIALNQLENCCHLSICYTTKHTLSIIVNEEVFNEEVVWPNRPGGIAGGCLYINREAWEKIKGYRVLGVYAGDDAYFLIDCALNNFSYQMITTIGLIHPHSNDIEYQKWKVLVCQRDSGTGNKENINHQIAEADEFWKNRKTK